MGALPGQRAAQRPVRAAEAAQGVLGRAARAGGGMAARMVLDIGGRRWEVVHDSRGRAVWTCRTTGERRAGGPDGELIDIEEE